MCVPPHLILFMASTCLHSQGTEWNLGSTKDGGVQVLNTGPRVFRVYMEFFLFLFLLV